MTEAGAEPAETASTRPSETWRASAAAICERAAFSVQMNSTTGELLGSSPSACAAAFRRWRGEALDQDRQVCGDGDRDQSLDRVCDDSLDCLAREHAVVLLDQPRADRAQPPLQRLAHRARPRAFSTRSRVRSQVSLAQALARAAVGPAHACRSGSHRRRSARGRRPREARISSGVRCPRTRRRAWAAGCCAGGIAMRGRVRAVSRGVDSRSSARCFTTGAISSRMRRTPLECRPRRGRRAPSPRSACPGRSGRRRRSPS